MKAAHYMRCRVSIERAKSVFDEIRRATNGQAVQAPVRKDWLAELERKQDDRMVVEMPTEKRNT